MSRSAVASVMIVALLAPMACAPTGGDRAALEATTAAWEDAFNAGDVDALGALYAEDAVLLAPNAEPIAGREAIGATFGEMIAAGLSGKLDHQEVEVGGDLGYKWGKYQLTTPDGAIADHGKYVEIWRWADGGWLMTRDIFNTSVAAPPPAPEAEAAEELDESGG